MFLISDLIGKEAITLCPAARQGTVLNVYFDSGLKKSRFVTLITSDEEDKKWVDFKELSAFWGDAIVISSQQKILTSPPPSGNNLAQNPINLTAFNQDGKALGIVRDIDLEGDKVIAFVTDTGKIESATLIAHSNEMLIFNDTGEPLKIKTPKQKRPQAPKKPKPVPAPASVKITAYTAEAQKSPDIIITGIEPKKEPQEEFKPQKKDVETPAKIPQGNTEVYRSPYDENSKSQSRYSFLLGKTMQQDVSAAGGVIIARQNDVIDENILSKAKEHGKLVSLTLHSL